jgi:hypothetical protein
LIDEICLSSDGDLPHLTRGKQSPQKFLFFFSAKSGSAFG